jgi:hypothetical protein
MAHWIQRNEIRKENHSDFWRALESLCQSINILEIFISFIFFMVCNDVSIIKILKSGWKITSSVSFLTVLSIKEIQIMYQKKQPKKLYKNSNII